MSKFKVVLQEVVDYEFTVEAKDKMDAQWEAMQLLQLGADDFGAIVERNVVEIKEVK